MAVFLGVDTGGTYTDAVITDAAQTTVLGKAKALTSRPDLSIGIAGAMGGALASAGVAPQDVALVSLSTTLATNALVEGQGGHVALIAVGFDAADLGRAGLAEALAGDPVIRVGGGHLASGAEAAPLDLTALQEALEALPAGLSGIAVAAQFAVRNPAHEIAVRDLVRARRDLPVTCSHELSARLGGPKRALTAVLNARLIGMIARLINACEAEMAARGIHAPLMVVRGDGALVSAAQARERPIETILSGPAASIVGARWLTGEAEALVSDIGGTTTDVALLRKGLPMIDPAGARVGRFRTMVEAVAMRTTGLGGDSEVHLVTEGLAGGLRLGPRRLIPVALVARDHGEMVHDALDRALTCEVASEHDGRFALRIATHDPGLTGREAEVFARLAAGPQPLGRILRTRLELAALERLVTRGLVMIAGVTPSDASHVLGRLADWDGAAATKALTLMARRRNGAGQRIAPDAATLARAIVAQLTTQTADCLLEAALAEDGFDDAEGLVGHPLMQSAVRGHTGALAMTARLAVPVIGLGASAPFYYGAVGERLGARMILPEHAGVANAIGAVVGQIAMRVSGLVTSPGEGRFTAHLAEGPAQYNDRDAALDAVETALRSEAEARARAAGAEDLRLSATRTIREAEIEGRAMFIEAEIVVQAEGRPRVAHALADEKGP
jgi:N-methylhydantoinase A/oxoprolinase/acetone carboxylase beta subunit